MMEENSYLQAYRKLNIQVGSGSSAKDAEQIIRQLGHLYNAMGEIIKDFVKVVKPREITAEFGTQYEVENKIGLSQGEGMDI